jgi:hypothetical protein
VLSFVRATSVLLVFTCVLGTLGCDSDEHSPPDCEMGTYDIPSSLDPTGICDPSSSDCTHCLQQQDDAGATTRWAVFEYKCRCSGSLQPLS